MKTIKLESTDPLPSRVQPGERVEVHGCEPTVADQQLFRNGHSRRMGDVYWLSGMRFLHLIGLGVIEVPTFLEGLHTIGLAHITGILRLPHDKTDDDTHVYATFMNKETSKLPNVSVSMAFNRARRELEYRTTLSFTESPEDMRSVFTMAEDILAHYTAYTHILHAEYIRQLSEPCGVNRVIVIEV